MVFILGCGNIAAVIKKFRAIMAEWENQGCPKRHGYKALPYGKSALKAHETPRADADEEHSFHIVLNPRILDLNDS